MLSVVYVVWRQKNRIIGRSAPLPVNCSPLVSAHTDSYFYKIHISEDFFCVGIVNIPYTKINKELRQTDHVLTASIVWLVVINMHG